MQSRTECDLCHIECGSKFCMLSVYAYEMLSGFGEVIIQITVVILHIKPKAAQQHNHAYRNHRLGAILMHTVHSKSSYLVHLNEEWKNHWEMLSAHCIGIINISSWESVLSVRVDLLIANKTVKCAKYTQKKKNFSFHFIFLFVNIIPIWYARITLQSFKTWQFYNSFNNCEATKNPVWCDIVCQPWNCNSSTESMLKSAANGNQIQSISWNRKHRILRNEKANYSLMRIIGWSVLKRPHVGKGN